MNAKSRLQNEIDAKLLGERKVFLWGQVDDHSAKHVVERLLYLEMLEPGKEIQLIINSPGGYVRITSYNVCYTKLLRIGCNNPHEIFGQNTNEEIFYYNSSGIPGILDFHNIMCKSGDAYGRS